MQIKTYLIKQGNRLSGLSYKNFFIIKRNVVNTASLKLSLILRIPNRAVLIGVLVGIIVLCCGARHTGLTMLGQQQQLQQQTTICCAEMLRSFGRGFIL